MNTAIAQHLNIAESAIVRVEEWANVMFAVVRGLGARFVSKKVVKKMSGNIEFVQGSESHSSSWGKYYVKGLEQFQVKEDFDANRFDRHHSYQGYVALDIPDGTVFTIFEQNGDKRGTDEFIFSICVVDQGSTKDDQSSYGDGFCTGNYKIIAQGNTKTLAPRLMGWWIDSPVKTLEFAQHCAAHINTRGLKNIPAMV
jgi:hypothetical protein